MSARPERLQELHQRDLLAGRADPQQRIIRLWSLIFTHSLLSDVYSNTPYIFRIIPSPENGKISFVSRRSWSFFRARWFHDFDVWIKAIFNWLSCTRSLRDSHNHSIFDNYLGFKIQITYLMKSNISRINSIESNKIFSSMLFGSFLLLGFSLIQHRVLPNFFQSRYWTIILWITAVGMKNSPLHFSCSLPLWNVRARKGWRDGFFIVLLGNHGWSHSRLTRPVWPTLDLLIFIPPWGPSIFSMGENNESSHYAPRRVVEFH